jgi:hypothetical protein
MLQVDPYAFHERVKKMYNWDDVAERTEVVYDRIRSAKQLPLLSRLQRFAWKMLSRCCGLVAGFRRILPSLCGTPMALTLRQASLNGKLDREDLCSLSCVRVHVLEDT